MKLNFVFAWTLVYFVKSSIANTSFKRPCEDLSEKCLTKTLREAGPSFIEGIPELGLEPLDPYHIERLDLKLPGNMKIKFTNGQARGLKRCHLDFARTENGFDESDGNMHYHGLFLDVKSTDRLIGNTFETQYHCNLTIKGRYKTKGKLMMLPIDGEGESTIRCHNLRLHSILQLRSKVEKDGQKYLEIINASFTHSYDGKVTYSMTNLFKRNPEMSRAVLDYMNSNWRMIAEEFGKPMVEFGNKCVLENLKKFLKQVPMDQIITAPVDF